MENKKSYCKEDYQSLYKVLNFRLPAYFKKIGLIGASMAFIFLIGYRFIGENVLVVKDILRMLILFFLLLASLSKDLIEDEYNIHVRHQSYVIAFVITTIYVITIPLISLLADLAITETMGSGVVSNHEKSSFEILFILLAMQILFFEALKKIGFAK